MHSFRAILSTLQKADNLSSQKNYNVEKEEVLYLKAIRDLKKIHPSIARSGNDSIAFLYYSKTGYLWYYFDSLDLAKQAYLKAIEIKEGISALPDSTLFQTLLFTGSIYYRQNEFDSAQLYFKRAEAIGDKYPLPIAGTERLFNWLGGMYYETGNYRQAKIYFEKAGLLLSPFNPYYKDLLIRYKNNIAASLTKLEKYTEADTIYTSILALGENTNEIINNIGIVNLKLNHPHKALEFFKKVHFDNELNVTLYNHIGKTYSVIGKLDSADAYYAKALHEHQKWNGNKKAIRHGYTYDYLAERLEEELDYFKAIKMYQQAIMQFYPAYDEENVYKNPEHFSGVFSYIDLFNTLVAKAGAFEKLYRRDKNLQSLYASLDAYRSAFELVRYVERVYESDEARLFLNNIKYKVHDKPIRLCLEAYDLTGISSYLEDAFAIDQQNKASVLSLNLQESTLKKQSGYHTDLFDMESSIKTATARLSLKAIRSTDSAELQKINNAIRDNEIQLVKLQEKINELPGYRVQKFSQSNPSIAMIQQLLNPATAILSYHLSNSELVILYITRKAFGYNKQVIDPSFFNSISSFKKALEHQVITTTYDGTKESIRLYHQIIEPIWSDIRSVNNLLIIPDDELNSLPFEALQNEKGQYLLEHFTIQYQYSTTLWKKYNVDNTLNRPILAMAPFSDGGNGAFAKLEFSKSEIATLHGSIFLDNAATKNIFVHIADQYAIIHLATHTIVNDTLPDKSLIAFYPIADSMLTESNLYLPEIYNLNLDSTELVILSACETGIGQLTKGEGLMSIARAFIYAGCDNIIASLWKADDQSTAWIMQRFYHHFQHGCSFAQALQKAKLDYLKSPDIEKRFKSPDYWAHLVLNGIPQSTHESYSTFMLIVLTIVITLSALTYRFYKRKYIFRK